MATAGPVVTELPAQEVRFLFGTMMDLRMLPNELKHTGNIAQGEFKIVAHFPAIHKTNGTEAAYLARHKTFRGGLYATYQEGSYKIDEVVWDATNRAGVHMVTMTKYGQTVEFPTQPSKTMPGSLKLMVQEYVESLKVPGFVIRCSGLGGALEPKKGTTDEYNVILLSGDAKCPKKLANHVPAKYHAEDESIFHAQVGPWCGNAESFEASGSGDKMTFGSMEWTWDTDEDDVDEDRINDLIEDQIQQDGAESGSGTLTEQNEEGFSYDVDYRWNHVMTDYNTAETGYHGAESFAAASRAGADLPREKRNVLSSVKNNYDSSFSWSACNWGPYFNRYAAEGSNKFYSVWVWERSPGIYTAMGAYGGLGQNPRLFNVGQTRDLQQAVNMAKKKLQSKQKKGYQTYTAEQMTQLGDSFFPVIPNTGGGDSALGSGRGVPQWYSAETLKPAWEHDKRGWVSNSTDETPVFSSRHQLALPEGSWRFIDAGAIVWENEYNQLFLDIELELEPNTTSRIYSNKSAEEFEAPMPFHSPSKGDVNKVIKSIRDRHKGIRLQGSPTYLTERKGGSNKYHVFQMTNLGGFNGYGRIGHTMDVFGPMSPKQYQSKLISKMKKGYKETGY
tara:strand:+ start:332 stop:2182 length:1851 start_codon:yes stop_codon:yes gene_type:complete